MPGREFLPCAGPLGTFIAVLAGTLAMLVFAANYHFMAQRREGSGGPVAYVRDVFGVPLRLVSPERLPWPHLAECHSLRHGPASGAGAGMG